jgi:hypothetical protein
VNTGELELKSATMIDTLKISRALASAGIEQPKAEALAQLFAETHAGACENFVTRARLDAQISELKTDLVIWLLGSQAVLLLGLVMLADFAQTVR